MIQQPRSSSSKSIIANHWMPANEAAPPVSPSTPLPGGIGIIFCLPLSSPGKHLILQCVMEEHPPASD